MLPFFSYWYFKQNISENGYYSDAMIVLCVLIFKPHKCFNNRFLWDDKIKGLIDKQRLGWKLLIDEDMVTSHHGIADNIT